MVKTQSNADITSGTSYLSRNKSILIAEGIAIIAFAIFLHWFWT